VDLNKLVKGKAPSADSGKGHLFGALFSYLPLKKFAISKVNRIFVVDCFSRIYDYVKQCQNIIGEYCVSDSGISTPIGR
jgi:hypothetical protein